MIFLFIIIIKKKHPLFDLAFPLTPFVEWLTRPEALPRNGIRASYLHVHTPRCFHFDFRRPFFLFFFIFQFSKFLLRLWFSYLMDFGSFRRAPLLLFS